MRYIAALMIVSIFLVACTKPAPRPIDWNNLYTSLDRETNFPTIYEHATR